MFCMWVKLTKKDSIITNVYYEQYLFTQQRNNTVNFIFIYSLLHIKYTLWEN